MSASTGAGPAALLVRGPTAWREVANSPDINQAMAVLSTAAWGEAPDWGLRLQPSLRSCIVVQLPQSAANATAAISGMGRAYR